MRWYWLIGCDNIVEKPYVASEGELGIDDWLLSDGQAVSDWPGDAWVKASSEEDDGQPDDVLQTHLPLPIYSSRLRSVLERAGVTGVQYLPIHVFHHDGRETSGYAIANILNKVSALDFEHSTYTLFPADSFLEERRGDVSSLLKPVLVRGPLNGYHIVRLDEYEAPIYVSEVFKTVFENGGFTGYSFSEVEVRDAVNSVAAAPARR